MTRLEELLLAWEGNALDEQGREELKQLLADPENRARLVEHLHLSEMIVTFFSEQDRSLREHSDDRPPFKVVPAFTRTFRQPVGRQTGKLIAFPAAPIAVAASLLLAIGVTVALHTLLQPPVVAVVEEVQGRVSARLQGELSAVRPGMKVREGVELIGRGADSGILFMYPDGSWVRIDGEARATVTGGDQGQRVHLSQGRLQAQLQKQSPDRPFVFSTAQALATVLGTRLGLEVDQEATYLRVDRGRVRLTRLEDGRSIEVRGGNTAVAGAGLQLHATPLVMASTRLSTDAGRKGPVAHLDFDGSEPAATPGGPGAGPALQLRRSDAGTTADIEQPIAGKTGEALATEQSPATVERSESFAPERMSLTLWFRVTSPRSDIEHPVLVDKERAEEQSGFALQGFEKQGAKRSDRIAFGVWTDQGRWSVSCRVPEPGQWNHVAVTFDGDTLTLFCNGRKADALAARGTRLLHNDKSLILGRFIGLLDELRLYDRPLSPVEVGELAAE